MLASDGVYVVHTVQQKCAGAWVISSLDLLIGSAKPTDRKRLEELYKPFKVDGACWTKTKIVGTFVAEEARQLAEELKRVFPKENLRIATIILSQATITQEELPKKLPTAKDYLNLPYGRQLSSRFDGTWLAEIAEFPNCAVIDKTAQSAAEALERAAEHWIEDQLAAGKSIPLPARRRR